MKLTASYVPLRDALAHRWTGLTRKQTKELNPSVVFTVLGAYLPFCAFAESDRMLTAWARRAALWEYQAKHGGRLPADAAALAELEAAATALLTNAEVNKQALAAVPRELLECVISGEISSRKVVA